MNKRFVPLVTAEDRAAALNGGAVDMRIPEDRVTARLRDEAGHTFDMPAVVRAVARAAGYGRGYANGKGGPKLPGDLKPSERVKQARAGQATIDALLDRLGALHPDLEAKADAVLYERTGEFVFSMRARLAPELYRLRAALGVAADQIGAESKTGPKARTRYGSERDRLADQLRELSEPPLSIAGAIALADDLLELCGLKETRKTRADAAK